MARMSYSGPEEMIRRLGRLDRSTMRRIMDAGAKEAQKRMREATRNAGHVRTRDMLEAVGPTPYFENVGKIMTSIYPQGEDRKGVRNATKAYVINYGRKKRRRKDKKHLSPTGQKRMGDKFITNAETATEAAVTAAMQAESDRILEEIDR